MAISLRMLIVALLCSSWAGAQDPAEKAKPLFRDFVGLNTHTVQFKPELYRTVTRLVRDYHGFEWDVGKETDYYPRFPLSRNKVDWEALYGGWKKAGYSTDVCVMFEQAPKDSWVDLERDAWAYGFQFARFFGPSGRQNLVESIEIGNEPGKLDDATYRRLFESVAGGARKGDPKLLISTCATFAEPSGAYHKDVATVKGLEALYDVLNVHSYPQLEGYPTWRRSFPEDPQLEFLTKIRAVIDWRNANAPGKQVWLTEFGYDSTTKPSPSEGDFKQWVGVTDEQQAQYLVRSLLVLSELDLDRAYIYWFNDADEPKVHSSSGITRNFQPKPSFHALAHLFAALGDCRFGGVVEKKPGEVCIDEFRQGENPDQRVWALWSPTGEPRGFLRRQRHFASLLGFGLLLAILRFLGRLFLAVFLVILILVAVAAFLLFLFGQLLLHFAHFLFEFLAFLLEGLLAFHHELLGVHQAGDVAVHHLGVRPGVLVRSLEFMGAFEIARGALPFALARCRRIRGRV